MRHIPLYLGLLLPAGLQAQEPSSAPVPAPPPLPSGVEDETIQPQVTITHKKDRTIEEYSVNGQRYMIKITPKKGVPYYLVDADGDGNLDTQSNELDPKILVPAWVILRW